MVEGLALITAFFYAVNSICIRKGLPGSDPTAAAVVSLSVSAAFFVLLFFLFVPFRYLHSPATLVFLIAGILAPGIFRFLSYTGVDRLGVTISSPISNSQTFVAVAIGILFLGERVTPAMVAGTLSIVLGIILLTSEAHKGKPTQATRVASKRDLIFPISAALVRGTSEALRKEGLNVFSSPFLGTMVTNLSGFVTSMVIMGLTGGFRFSLSGGPRNYFMFALGGMASAMAWVASFHALSRGDLVRVVPLITTAPLFTLLLSYVFLREVERFTWKIIAGTVAVVSGIIFIKFL